MFVNKPKHFSGPISLRTIISITCSFSNLSTYIWLLFILSCISHLEFFASTRSLMLLINFPEISLWICERVSYAVFSFTSRLFRSCNSMRNIDISFLLCSSSSSRVLQTLYDQLMLLKYFFLLL